MLHLLFATAVAVPTFVAEDKADAEIAKQAWEAATLCTGWEAKSHSTIEIRRGALRDSLLGLAHHDDNGVYRIDIAASEDRTAEVLVHELAHAWVRNGPPTLLEGRTQLLADCIALERPGLAPLQWDDGRDLALASNVRTWDNTEDHGPRTANERTDAYLAASRLVRAASLLLPAQALWPEDDAVDWTEFEALLAKAGPEAEPFLALIQAEVAAQRDGLSDTDRDGLPKVGERMFNTDPDRWDTDGDGWWDGAAVPGNVVPLPFDGTPTCSGWASPSKATSVTLNIGGNLRGSPAPVPKLYIGGTHAEHASALIAPDTSVLVSMQHGSEVVSGGLWARVTGDDLVPDTACANHPRYSLWAVDPGLKSLVPGFGVELERALERADAKLGKLPLRMAVSIGGESTLVENGVVLLSTREVIRAIKRGEVPYLANQVVAMHRITSQQSLVRDWRDVEAMANAIGRP